MFWFFFAIVTNMQKQRRNNILLLAGALVLAAVLSVGAWYFSGWNRPAPADPFETAPVGKSNAKLTTEEQAAYDKQINEGLAAAMAGDNGDKAAYDRAIAAYKEAATISHYSNWIPYYNLGDVYRRAGDFNRAENAYNNALKISNGGQLNAYLAKAEMYRYQLNKSPEEIKAVYEEAMAKSDDLDNAQVAYAAYLKEIGDNSAALKYYQALLKTYPDNQVFKDQVTELSR